VLILLLIPGSQILVYPVLWILMPSEESASAYSAPVEDTPVSYTSA
jgi:phage shock protein PspC (stress-responsive transcriptional regulator)